MALYTLSAHASKCTKILVQSKLVSKLLLHIYSDVLCNRCILPGKGVDTEHVTV